jgi:hypothetical protein
MSNYSFRDHVISHRNKILTRGKCIHDIRTSPAGDISTEIVHHSISREKHRNSGTSPALHFYIPVIDQTCSLKKAKTKSDMDPDAVIDDAELLAMLRCLGQDSCDIEPLLCDFNAAVDGRLPPPFCSQQLSSVSAKYQSVIARLDSAIRQTQQLISVIEGASSSPSRVRTPAAPPPQFVPSAGMFDCFLSRELPVVGLPYPPLCGSRPPDPDSRLPLGAFVAVRLSQFWALCYVIAQDGDGYLVCDAESHPGTGFHADLAVIVPLPTSLPDKKTKATEFAAGARVLALWPEDGLWTSVFYEATVLKPPSDTGDGYKLKFDGFGKPITIPQSFVIDCRTDAPES